MALYSIPVSVVRRRYRQDAPGPFDPSNDFAFRFQIEVELVRAAFDGPFNSLFTLCRAGQIVDALRLPGSFASCLDR
jgi:hypothetical protein